jgi:hypothetical protein
VSGSTSVSEAEGIGSIPILLEENDKGEKIKILWKINIFLYIYPSKNVMIWICVTQWRHFSDNVLFDIVDFFGDYCSAFVPECIWKSRKETKFAMILCKDDDMGVEFVGHHIGRKNGR